MVTKKQIAKEIGKDMGKRLKGAAQTTAAIACLATYPIVGNLSNNLQQRLQRLLPGVYNSEYTYETSKITNYLTRIPTSATLLGIKGYEYALSNLGEELSRNGQLRLGACLGVAGGAIIAGVYTYFENVFRDGHLEEIREKGLGSKNLPNSSASLIGKVVSLPFDGITYAYDAGANYIEGVKRRIEAREKTSGSLDDKAVGGKE